MVKRSPYRSACATVYVSYRKAHTKIMYITHTEFSVQNVINLLNIKNLKTLKL